MTKFKMTKIQNSKIYFFIIIFIILSLKSFSQDFSISGVVVDSTDKKPLAFVNIILNNSRFGTTTDIDGKFSVNSKEKINFLKCSYVGYKPKTYFVSSNTKKIIIKLQKTEIELSEVVIIPGINPAHRIINKAVENKDLNNPEKMKSFAYTSYNKMIFTSDVEEINKMDTAKLDSSDIRLKKFLDEQYIFLMESVTKRKFKYPDKNNEKVIASRISGLKDPFFVLLATQMQSFSFYNPTINISDKYYINPISKGSTKKYFFLIEDTLYSNNDTVFIISFRPLKNKNFDGIKGVLYINTNKYAIQNVIAQPAEEDKSIEIKIQQQYEFVKGAQWFPRQLNTDIIFHTIKLNDLDLMGIGRMYIKDIKLDPEFKNKEFDNTIVQFEKDANKQDEQFWSIFRIDSLTDKDIKTYHVIDSIGRKNKLDEKAKAIQILLSGKIPWGPINFDLDKFMSYTEYEGFRFGAGIHTNEKISKFFTVGGYYAYSLTDKASKYGGDINFLLHRNSELELKYSYKNDVEESGGFNQFDTKGIFSDNKLRDYLIRKMNVVEENKISISFRTFRYLKINCSLAQTYKSVTNDYQYGIKQGNVNVLLKDFNFTEIAFGLRYAYKEKFIKSPLLKVSLGTNYPIIWVEYSKGINNLLNGQFAYQKIDFKLKKSFYIKYFGKPTFQLHAGYVDGDIPYSNLYVGQASYRNFIYDAPNSFATMRMNEFLSSKFVSLYFKHSFGKLLVRTKKIEPEFVITTNIGFGTLQNKSSHHNVDFKTMEKGYYESGLLINNLLNMKLYTLGLGLYYRYGPYGFEKISDNFAAKLTFVFPF